ncbi:hypothetical protein CsatA_006140 [Cannabis sativa]
MSSPQVIGDPDYFISPYNYTQPNTIEQESHTGRFFIINLNAMFNLDSPSTIEDDEPLFDDETEYPITTIENIVQISYETLMNINNTEALITIQDMFAAVYLHSFSFIIDEIIDCSRKMMNNNNLNEEVGVDVYVHVVVNELPQLDWDDDDDDEEDDDYNMDDFPICFVASSEESIEKLEKVQVKDNPIFCSICLEDVSVGSEATKLPCTHAYHKQCVVEWLQVSKFCPNCRVEIV